MQAVSSHGALASMMPAAGDPLSRRALAAEVGGGGGVSGASASRVSEGRGMGGFVGSMSSLDKGGPLSR